MSVRILSLMNSFKGTASSRELNLFFYKYFRKKGYTVDFRNISDGGDGFIDSFIGRGDRIIRYSVTGPFYNMKVRPRVLLKKNSAFIEIAEICGIKYLTEKQFDIINATTYGVGEVIYRLITERKVKNMYIGLGGTASNDAGFGMARALGIRFLDGYGREIENNIYGLLNLGRIDFSGFKLKNFKYKVYAISDVENRLLGKYGSARVFGPQKGAGKKEIEIIEKALKRLRTVLKKQFGVDINIKSSAAAGGLAAGLFGFLNAEILNGSNFVIEKNGVKDIINKFDIVFTGEGKFDRSSFYGKITGEIIRLAKKHGKKVIFLCALSDYNARVKNVEVVNLSKYYNIKKLREDLFGCLSDWLDNYCKI